LDEFIRVLSTYFREEELLMEEMQYVDLQRHHSEHAVVVGELLGLKARYRRGSTDFSDSIRTLRAVILNHLVQFDRALLAYSCQTEPLSSEDEEPGASPDWQRKPS
jgi:hemerythrin